MSLERSKAGWDGVRGMGSELSYVLNPVEAMRKPFHQNDSLEHLVMHVKFFGGVSNTETDLELSSSCCCHNIPIPSYAVFTGS